jgi:hypothetical protein
MGKPSKKPWIVRRLYGDPWGGQYMVVRRSDGWVYQYTDTRVEADKAAKEANESIGDGKVPCSTDAIYHNERKAGA